MISSFIIKCVHILLSQQLYIYLYTCILVRLYIYTIVYMQAFEAYDGGKDPRAVTVLKYMLLTKVLSGHSEDVPGIMSTKMAVKYTVSICS